MSRMDNLLGVVLCGGESRRMGKDKGLLTDGDSAIPWALRMAHKLQAWNIPVWFSINARQQAAYSAVISSEQLIIDSIGLPGPLNGLFSVHARFPGKDLLLLACDMLDLDEPTLAVLLAAYQEKEGYDFYVFREGAFTQPFAGIYTAAGLATVYRLARAGGLDNFRLRSLLDGDRVLEIPVTNGEAFRNYNAL